MKCLDKLFIIILLFVWACSSKNSEHKEQKGTDSISITTTMQTTTTKNILFFGNSLTAGFGLEIEESFPSLIQKKIDSLNLPYKVINAGNSGETSAGGNSRIDWILRQKVDIFVLELGANDGLRGISTAETKKNLQSILQKVKAKNPDVKLVVIGMEVPPNMGERYASEFRNIFPEIAKEYNAALVPFLLDGVAANPSLNLPDGIHPNAKGQVIVAENVWKVLKEIV
ncbi:MAG: arylesterase [Flammeovirgaceae bacterium]